jgi:hypothetical protein
MRPFIIAFVALLPALGTQPKSRWKEIGKTSTGNTVYVDPRSVKNVKGVVTARIRVKFAPPVKTASGTWVTSQHLAMFDCAKSTFAAKESTYYSDESGTTVVQHNVNKLPGFGPAIGGSMTKVALDYLCAAPAKR